MIDSLKTIGIEKGKPFKPGAKTRAILDQAAQQAHAVIALKYEKGFVPPFFEGRAGRCRSRRRRGKRATCSPTRTNTASMAGR